MFRLGSSKPQGCLNYLDDMSEEKCLSCRPFSLLCNHSLLLHRNSTGQNMLQQKLIRSNAFEKIETGKSKTGYFKDCKWDNRKIQNRVYCLQQTSDSGRQFFRLENINSDKKKQSKAQLFKNRHETSYFSVEAINIKRQGEGNSGHVVQLTFAFCRGHDFKTL